MHFMPKVSTICRTIDSCNTGIYCYILFYKLCQGVHSFDVNNHLHNIPTYKESVHIVTALLYIALYFCTIHLQYWKTFMWQFEAHSITMALVHMHPNSYCLCWSTYISISSGHCRPVHCRIFLIMCKTMCIIGQPN